LLLLCCEHHLWALFKYVLFFRNPAASSLPQLNLSVVSQTPANAVHLASLWS
jgi:hypothetical protein